MSCSLVFVCLDSFTAVGWVGHMTAAERHIAAAVAYQTAAVARSLAAATGTAFAASSNASAAADFQRARPSTRREGTTAAASGMVLDRC